MLESSAISLLERLVSFDTTSRNSNLALIAFVEEYLRAFGVPCELVSSADGRKANLYATVGPNKSGGILLAGHTDVVPVDGQAWSGDPFRLRKIGDRLVGRGSADMKGFVASALSHIPAAVTSRLAHPLHLALTFDEEVDCLGALTLTKHLANRTVKPAACVLGEPTLMRPIVAHKGKLSLRCRVHGAECHSAVSHRGVNAVEHAALLIGHFHSMTLRFHKEGPHDADFDPPYTTVHTGVIQGGEAVNIVPKDCVFDFEVRHIPSHPASNILAEIHAETERLVAQMVTVSKTAGIEYETISAIPPLACPVGAPVMGLVTQLAKEPGYGKVSFGTEGGIYQEIGIPTVLCGPGSIEQAHKPDEWISLDQVAACDRFMDRLVQRLCQATPLS